MKKKQSLFILLFPLFFACKNEKSIDLTQEFSIEKGFQIDALLETSLLVSPVEIEFDEKGRIWVVELTGYMRDVDGSGEDIPDGRISILEDTDGDGILDNKKVFLDELILPRAIELIHNGLLYAEPPNLWWVSINENDEPGEFQLIDSTYANGGNIEHASNGLLYNLDNWIYSAKCDRRYRFKDGKWERDATYFKGQWGISNDDAGRLYYNNNSNPILGDFIQSNQVNANPFLHGKSLEKQNLSKSRRFYPAYPTLVNRGYTEGTYDSLGRVKEFTSACSPILYRGNQFKSDYYENAFVCGPEGNLIKRYQLVKENGKTKAIATSEGTEFLTSNKETFRPVNLNNGPDGAFYVVDMNVPIIQHSAYMTSYLKELIIKNKMDSIPRGGRIFRISDNSNTVEKLPNFSKLALKDWIPLLQSPNAWQRTTAQKKLVFANDKSLMTAITAIAKDAQYPLGQIHALWTLEGMSALSPTLLTEISTEDTRVLSQAILLAKGLLNKANEAVLMPIFEKALASADYDHHLQLAHSIRLLADGTREKIALELAGKHAEDALISEALISGLAEKEQSFLKSISHKKEDGELVELLNQTIANRASNDKKELKISIADQTDNRTRGFALYQTYCATCHGLDGKGIENLAPPLYQSEYVDGPVERLILIALNGLRGPITVHGKTYEGAAVMPGMKNNPDLTDQAINDILSFIKNGFTSKPVWFSLKNEKIANLRAATADRKEMFTEEELQAWE